MRTLWGTLCLSSLVPASGPLLPPDLVPEACTLTRVLWLPLPCLPSCAAAATAGLVEWLSSPAFPSQTSGPELGELKPLGPEKQGVGGEGLRTK